MGTVKVIIPKENLTVKGSSPVPVDMSSMISALGVIEGESKVSIKIDSRRQPIQMKSQSTQQIITTRVSQMVPIQVAPGTTGASPTGNVGTIIREYIAGMFLNALRVLAVNTEGKMVYADHRFISNAPRIIGISTYTSSQNLPIDVISYGYWEDSAWSFTPGQPLFLGVDGEIVETVPSTGFIAQIATSITRVSIQVSLQIPIKI
jgi:hypothetical protein